jgi:predicted dehydrogenase
MPIQIGFVGTGGIANTHFDALSNCQSAARRVLRH